MNSPANRIRRVSAETLRDARWLFFDMGNTLISEEAATADRIRRFAEVFGRRGMPYSINDIELAYQEASEQFAPYLGRWVLEKLVDDLELRSLIAAEVPYPREMDAPFDGAVDALRALASHYKIGIIANQPLGSEERLTRWGLMPFVSVCIASAEVGTEKPDPAIFNIALGEAGCSAAEAVIIGDRLDNDIRPARMLGWKTIRVLQGPGRFQVPRDDLDEADLTVPAVKSILPIFLAPMD
jgi:8-oxo-dGTP diphosphatase/putative hydrolase of the HAD superfamily